MFKGLTERFGWWKTVIVGLAALLSACVTIGTFAVKGVKAFDGRYAKEQQVHEAIQSQKDRMDFQVNDLKIETLKNRRTGLRDKKFDLEERCRTTPAQCSTPVRQRTQELTEEIAEVTATIQKLGGQ